jgi:hypothetical protein
MNDIKVNTIYAPPENVDTNMYGDLGALLYLHIVDRPLDNDLLCDIETPSLPEDKDRASS